MNTTDTRRKLFLGTAMVLLQTLFWGIGNPMLKYALSVMPLYWCLTLRFIPTAILALLIFRPKLGVIFGNKKTLASCTLLSVFTAAAYIFANLGLKYTSATMAGFLLLRQLNIDNQSLISSYASRYSSGLYSGEYGGR